MRVEQDLAISAMAAGSSHFIHHPLYTLKSQMMFNGSNFRFKVFFSDVIECPSILYRGVVSRTFGIMPEKAFKMLTWNMVKKFMEEKFEGPPIINWLVAGSAAGAATTIIGCPSERAMVLAHIQKQAFLAVIRKTGVCGLYLGFRTTLYRDISFNAMFFTSREQSLLMYRKWEEDPQALKRVLLGFPAAILACVVACPFDVVKTRQQGAELGSKSESCARIMWNICRHESPRFLMKGLLPRLVAVPSMMSCFYVIYEELKGKILGSQLVS